MLVKHSKKEKWSSGLTDELNKYLRGRNDVWYVYIHIMCEDDKNGYLSLRVPGQTIGYIQLDSNKTIIDIVIGDWSMASFSCDLKQIFNKYIGRRVYYEF